MCCGVYTSIIWAFFTWFLPYSIRYLAHKQLFWCAKLLKIKSQNTFCGQLKRSRKCNFHNFFFFFSYFPAYFDSFRSLLLLLLYIAVALFYIVFIAIPFFCGHCTLHWTVSRDSKLPFVASMLDCLLLHLHVLLFYWCHLWCSHFVWLLSTSISTTVSLQLVSFSLVVYVISGVFSSYYSSVTLISDLA